MLLFRRNTDICITHNIMHRYRSIIIIYIFIVSLQIYAFNILSVIVRIKQLWNCLWVIFNGYVQWGIRFTINIGRNSCSSSLMRWHDIWNDSYGLFSIIWDTYIRINACLFMSRHARDTGIISNPLVESSSRSLDSLLKKWLLAHRILQAILIHGVHQYLQVHGTSQSLRGLCGR